MLDLNKYKLPYILSFTYVYDSSCVNWLSTHIHCPTGIYR